MFWCILLLTTIISSARGLNVGLNATGIRLAGGSGPYEGRVEVRVNGIWGTICDENFDVNDAKVLCRMMNLSATLYAGNARYGQGSGPIFATNFRCNGQESHIRQCHYDMTTTCGHSEDMSIICSECGYIHLVNSERTSISSDGTTLSATCKSGFYLNDNTSLCGRSNIWNPPSLICKPGTPITNIRLANGLGLFDGRVEIMINGTWGDVCTSSFGWNSAVAICSMLFNLPVYTYYIQRYNSHDYGYNTHVHIDKLDCLGNETDIQECNFDFSTSCSFYRAAVICNAYPLNITDIRLTNGTGSNNGRLELKYNDIWGTVCNRFLYDSDANILCRMLNSSLTCSYTDAKFGSGTGPMLIGTLPYCSSTSNHINNCSTPYRPPQRPYCTNNSIATLICTDCGQPSIPNGEITSSSGTIMTVTCNKAYAPTTYTIECLSNGTWLQSKTCEVFDCRCKSGWNGTYCTKDINECDNRTICSKHSTCSNTDGGYNCKCYVGYFKTSFGICTVCDDTHYGENCAKECTCIKANTVSCSNTNGNCKCDKGWTGKNCSVDENECDKVPDVCEVKENSTCKNTQGSYKCICGEGFSEIGDTCVDSFDPNDDACKILHDLGTCELENCVEENGTAHCKTPSNKLDSLQIIGISVGCGIFVICIAISVIIWLWRRKKLQ